MSTNEYPQYMFLWRIDKNYPSVTIKYPHLFYWYLRKRGTRESTSFHASGEQQNKCLKMKGLGKKAIWGKSK